MEENNMSEGDVTEKNDDDSNNCGSAENNKRLRTDSDSPQRSGESNSQEPPTNYFTLTDLASTSNSDSGFLGFPRMRNDRNRYYRKNKEDENNTANNNQVEEDVSEPDYDLLPTPLFDVSPGMSDTSDYLNHAYLVNENEEEPAVLKKKQPKHNWFIVNEIASRQMGRSTNFNPDLFYSRCYGSLHCVQRLELMHKLESHKGCVNSLNFHPDGSLLASGSDDLKVVIWDWKHGRPLLSFDTEHRSNVFQSKFLQLGGDLHIVTCARDGQVRLSQVSAQEGLRSNRNLGWHRGPCHKLAVLKDQPQVVLSAGEDGMVFRHDLRNSQSEELVHLKLREADLVLYSISSHPLNPNEFCVGGRDHIVRSYDQRKCGGGRVTPLKLYTPFQKNVSKCLLYHATCALYNHNGSEILTSYNDEDIYLFDVNGEQHTFVHQYMGHRNGATIKGVNFFGPNSEFIVSGSDCGNIFFWDRNTEAIVQFFLADDNGVVNCLEPHPQVPYICTSGLDWDIKLWVPSFESETALHGLAKAVTENVSGRSQWTYTSEHVNGSQMLWLLWRHLSSRDRMRRSNALYNWPDVGTANSHSTSGNSSSESDDDGPPSCAAS